MRDNDYLRRRAAEELAAAAWATSPQAKQVHRALARRYLAQIENDPPMPEPPSPASAVRTTA